MNRLTIIGLVGTFIYVAGAGFLASFNWAKFSQLTPNEWGDFFAGVFGPLALFWVVLGFFQQGRELQNSSEALRHQVDELKKTVQQHEAMVAVTKDQLELDRTAREEERDALIDQRMPHFICSLREPFTHTGKTFVEVAFHNVGSDAQNADLIMLCSSKKVKEPKTNIFTGQKFVWSVEITGIQLKECRFFVDMWNVRGEQKTQKFKVTHDRRLKQYESVTSARARNRNWSPEMSEDYLEKS